MSLGTQRQGGGAGPLSLVRVFNRALGGGWGLSTAVGRGGQDKQEGPRGELRPCIPSPAPPPRPHLPASQAPSSSSGGVLGTDPLHSHPACDREGTFRSQWRPEIEGPRGGLRVSSAVERRTPSRCLRPGWAPWQTAMELGHVGDRPGLSPPSAAVTTPGSWVQGSDLLGQGAWQPGLWESARVVPALGLTPALRCEGHCGHVQGGVPGL